MIYWRLWAQSVPQPSQPATKDDGSKEPSLSIDEAVEEKPNDLAQIK
jgi:hypothetical protein